MMKTGSYVGVLLTQRRSKNFQRLLIQRLSFVILAYIPIKASQENYIYYRIFLFVLLDKSRKLSSECECLFILKLLSEKINVLFQLVCPLLPAIIMCLFYST